VAATARAAELSLTKSRRVVSGVGMAGSPDARDDALYTMRRRAELPESEVYRVWGDLGEWIEESASFL